MNGDERRASVSRRNGGRNEEFRCIGVTKKDQSGNKCVRSHKKISDTAENVPLHSLNMSSVKWAVHSKHKKANWLQIGDTESRIAQPACPAAMTIKELQSLKPYVKISALADEIDGINKHTLLSKVRRGTELTIVESDKLEEKLDEVMMQAGFALRRQ